MRRREFYDRMDKDFFKSFPTSYGKPIRFVDPSSTRTEEQYPYSFDAYYIWGHNLKSDSAVYSDRLNEWNRSAYQKAIEQIKKPIDHWDVQTVALFFNIYYEGKLNKPVTTDNICALAKCCNVSTGYPIHIFFTKELDLEGK